MTHEETGFAHVHIHSDFSLLDGFGTVEEYAARAVKINQKFLCVSDHGAQGAVPRQIKACEEHNLSPIFACELYVNPWQVALSSEEERKTHLATLNEDEKARLRKNYHLLAIAYNEVGYSNLVRLSSWGYIQGWGGRPARPRVNREQLMAHKEGIIFTSCCYSSEIGVAFDTRGEDAAMDMVAKYIEMFGENFRLEIMMLDFTKQKPYDRFILKAHAKFGVPLFLSQDTHYCNKEDSKYQRYMLMVQTGRTVMEIERLQAEGADLFELQDQQLWMKSEDELNQFWESDYSDVIDYDLFKEAKRESVRICEKARGVKLDRSNKLPQVPDEKDKLTEAVIQGYKWRNLPKDAVYQRRIMEELDLINRKGFASYFLIQKQMTDEARRICPEIMGWGDGTEAVGPGRGCLSGDSRIVMAKGQTKPIADVIVGDLVPTHDGTIRKVVNTFVYPCNEPLLTIKSYYGDAQGVTLTKDHKVYAERMKRPLNYENWSHNTQRARRSILEPEGRLEWIPAGDLQIGDWVYIPQICSIDRASNYLVYDLSEFCNGKDMIVNGDYVEQLRFNNLTGRLQDRKISNRHIKLDEEWCCLLGIFASDGWIRSNASLEVGFVFHEDETDSLSFTQRILRLYGFDRQTVAKDSKKKCVQLKVNSRFLHLFIQKMFPDYRHTAETKHVPPEIMGLDERCINAFLHGYHLGDGSLGEHKTTASSVSRRLVDEIRYLLLKSRIPSSIGYEDRKDDRPDFSNSKSSFVLRTPKDERIIGEETSQFRYVYHLPQCGGIMTKIRSIEESTGHEFVYDFEVEESHSFLTSSFVVHNSAVGALTCYCLGITDVDPIKHGLLFSRFLSEARGGKTMKLRFSNIDPVPLESVGA